MLTRREALGLLGSMSAAALVGRTRPDGTGSVLDALRAQGASETPTLAPGTPNSPERLALIEAFRRTSDGVQNAFESHEYRKDFAMPYRLFRPNLTERVPLVVFLHGSGGLGTDNVKQMGLGNIFGTRVWAMPENQKTFPCFVVAPQTDRGWINYAPAAPGDSVARIIPGLGDGARLAFEIIDQLIRTYPIDARRIYITGQSMGGGGAWHMIAQRPRVFAAAAICCGVATLEKAAASIGTPIWNFHGDADNTVPVAVSRERITSLRKAGGHPLYTEYAGVAHNVWEWAYTEPSLASWLFAHHRAS